MAVSKRTRYEVLRRDGFACRYCGGAAPDVRLTVDHVMPVALGGNDEPSNLVAACVDCNSGKASTKPDDEIVDDVRRDALRWSRAVTVAARAATQAAEDRQSVIDAVLHNASLWRCPMSWPASWEATVLTYWDNGLTVPLINEAYDIAMRKRLDEEYARYPYFCGVMRNKLKEITEAAQALIEGGEA